ncbi:uncharacterized protein LOC134180227 [Corticium candelabrum]|uniref:uncharacterized protein LOC134180227 n=1 Tax=Corticium candelabrum TaxID=121492 RepID=UPI002E25DEEE|nr:uncharacterized protein LOC134180227 [Corticium candelabrum]
MSSWLRKKKQQIGAIHLLAPGGQADWIIPIEFKPRLLVQDLINLAAEKAKIKTIAVPFFGLYNRESRYWLYPFRYLDKNDAAIDWSFRVQFKVKNSVELRRLDSVAFEYYIMQCRSDFVSDAYSNVGLQDALRLACLDILLATLRLNITFQSALKQFGLQHFLPKSARDKLKTQDALIDVLTRSFKNFENMTDEAAAIRYVEIIEQLPSFDVHRFKMNLAQSVMGESISESVVVTLSHLSGLVLVRQEVYKESICSLNDVASVRTCTSAGSGSLLVHLNRANGATRVFSCGSMKTLETFCSMVDGYCRLLIDNTKTIIEGIIHPDGHIPRMGLGSGPLIRKQSPTNGRGQHVHSNGTVVIESVGSEQHGQSVREKPCDLDEEKLQVHGPISRDEAKQLLQTAGLVDGLYLVRENARVKGGYSLSVCIGNEVKHYLIQRHCEGYGIQDGLRYPTVSNLLNHYHEERDGLCTKLVKVCLPVPTKDSPFIDRKIETEEQPPPVPLSPRPNTQCSLSSNLVTVCGKVGEGLFGNIHLGEMKVRDGDSDQVTVLLSCLDNASFVVGKQLTQFSSTLFRLNHKRLVKYFGLHTVAKSTYLVQEFAPLGPIDEHLAKHKQSEMSEKFLLGVAAQVAEGLSYLDSQSCVHGGLTAHSVLLVSPSTVKISDVGLVGQTAAVSPDYFNEEHGLGRHLLPWLAVECVNGVSLSHASDVWAAGVVLWELFNYGKRKPFDSLSPTQVKNLIKTGQQLSAIQGCSAGVYELMKQCWSDVSTRLSSRGLCEALLTLARKVSASNPSGDSLQTTQIASSTGKLGFCQDGSDVQHRVASTSVFHQRSFSDSGQPDHSSSELASQRSTELNPTFARSMSCSGRAGQAITVQHPSSALTSQRTLVTGPVAKPRKSPKLRNQGAPSPMSLGLEELAKTSIIHASELSLLADLGSGQFGVVKKAVWMKSDGTKQETAVKALIADADVHQQQDFFQEAKSMIALDNPYIVRLLGICFEPSLLLVTELVSLGAVNSYLRNLRHEPPATNTLIRYCLQIATGMTYLASQKFVHRDLAARNILVASPQLVKIADFGLSRVFGGEKEYYVAANQGQWPLKWYAPESINFKRFSHKSDVWSYGVAIWEIFMLGRKPYGKILPRSIMEYIDSGKRLSKPDLCPQSVYEVMQSCWEYEQEDRPTFDEICQKMECFWKQRSKQTT